LTIAIENNSMKIEKKSGLRVTIRNPSKRGGV